MSVLFRRDPDSVQCLNHCRKALDKRLDTHRWVLALKPLAHSHLLGQVGDVDKAGGDVRLARCGEEVEHAVEQVVADVRPCRVRHARGDARRLHVGDHLLDRQRRPVGDGAVLRDGVIALVVGDAEIVDVDANAFDRDVGAAARLSDDDDGIGRNLIHRSAYRIKCLVRTTGILRAITS